MAMFCEPPRANNQPIAWASMPSIKYAGSGCHFLQRDGVMWAAMPAKTPALRHANVWLASVAAGWIAHKPKQTHEQRPARQSQRPRILPVCHAI